MQTQSLSHSTSSQEFSTVSNMPPIQSNSLLVDKNLQTISGAKSSGSARFHPYAIKTPRRTPEVISCAPNRPVYQRLPDPQGFLNIAKMHTGLHGRTSMSFESTAASPANIFRRGKEKIPANARVMAWGPPLALATSLGLRHADITPEHAEDLIMVLAASSEPKTQAGHGAGLKSWIDFAADTQLSEQKTFDPDAMLVACFLASFAGTQRADTTMGKLFAIKRWQTVHGLPIRASLDPSSLLFEELKKGLVKLQPDAATLRRPFFPQDLHAVIRNSDLNCPAHIAVIAALTTQLFGAMRSGELTIPSQPAFNRARHVQRKHIKLLSSDIFGLVFQLSIPWTKTTGYKGAVIFVPQHDHFLDPVKWLCLHLSVNKPDAEDSLFSYLETDARRAGQRRHLTKSYFVDHINSCLSQEGLARVSGHCMRIGAACLYLLWGYTEDWVQVHGRWGSKDTFRKYWREVSKINLIQSTAALALLPKPAKKGAIPASGFSKAGRMRELPILSYVDLYPLGLLGGPNLSLFENA